MDYNTLNTYLQTLIVDQAPSSDYTTILPAAIQDAENRIYRELDFLATRTVNATSSFTTGSRTLTIPVSPTTIIILQGVAQITPAPSAPAAGTRNQLELSTLDFIDYVWPIEATTGPGEYWAMKDAATIVVGPTPDQNYVAELTGIFRPALLSPSNQTDYISLVYPDLLVSACMCFLTGYQRDFGAQSDDPKMAMSWEVKYQDAKKSALLEEQRRKGSGVGWSPFSETPVATPPRT